MPKVTVVIPTYRRPHYLRTALASVLGQTERDLHVLVCDNAAQDSVADVVDMFADRRVTYVPRSQDLGLMANALDGFRRTDSELVMKLDDDDVLEPACLETLVAPFRERPALALSFSNFHALDEWGNVRVDEEVALSWRSGRDRTPEGFHRPFTALAARGTIHLVSAVLRRDAVDWHDVPPDVGSSYDLHLALVAAQEARWGHYCARRLASYRIHSQSDSARRLAVQLTGALNALERALASGLHTDTEVLEDQVAATALRLGRTLLRDGRPLDALLALRRAAELRPGREVARLLALTVAPPPLRTTALGFAARRSQRQERALRADLVAARRGPGPVPLPRGAASDGPRPVLTSD